MQKSSNKTKPGHLKPFLPFAEMAPEYVIIAANFGTTQTVEAGAVILDANSEDPNDIFLLNGAVSVEDIYGAETDLSGESAGAKKPLPQLRPSAYKITAKESVTIIKIPQEVIRRVRSEAPEKLPELDEDVTLDITQSREFFYDFKEELQMNRVRLPSPAPNAARIHRLISGPKLSVEELIQAVSRDPAIAAKLLKMGNSSLFNADGKVSNLEDLVTRLGLYSTREMAACFAFRDVFKNSSPELTARLEEQVAQSRQVSAISTVIAEISGVIDPRTASLAGLLHNVGVLPIFSYAMHNVAYAMNSDLVDRAIKKMSTKTGVLLAKKWRFGEDVIASIEESENWEYESGEKSDLTSIVVAAKYHWALGKFGIASLPKPKDVPSIAAATNGLFDEKLSLNIIGRAKDLMAQKAAA